MAKDKKNPAESPSPETDSSPDQAQASESDDKPQSNDPPAELPPTQKPSLGRIVHYSLSAQDVENIERDLKIGHVNCLSPGDLVVGIVVRTFGELANLRLLMDGECRREPWVTSRAEGTTPGTWRWPARV